MMNDIFTGTITFALERAINEYKDREDEAGKVLYESLIRSKAVWETLYVCGLELFGMSYERFLEQCKEKKNIIFFSDDEFAKFKKAKKIMNAMGEEEDG